MLSKGGVEKEFMVETFINLTKNAVNRAREFESAGNFKRAAEEYGSAASLLAKAAKYTKTPAIRKMYLERADEYLRLSESYSHKKRAVAVGPAGALPKEEAEEMISSIMESVIVEKPSTTWADIGGLEEPKARIREAIILPLKRPEVFKGPLKPWKGILLFGPPGCGKTLLAKAAANECEATFFNMSAADILSKWFGESEKLVKTLFGAANQKAPSIIFIDEIDSIAAERTVSETGAERRVLTQVLREMDGVEELKNVLVMAATNMPWILDPAVLRRFEKRVHIPLPDAGARRKIFDIHLKGAELAKDVDLDALTRMTSGYSGSDVERVCREAAMNPLREAEKSGDLMKAEIKLRPIEMADFERAIKSVKTTVVPEYVRKYDEWGRKFGAD
jgi:SpoVK/Ycf46/Vps4 family AAA+-type ATPase